MKLLLSPASPYARKVWLAAAELGLEGRIEATNASASPVADTPELSALNPLGKIPVLITDEGDALFDSRVIADYLDSLTPRRLCPASGEARWRVQTLHAAADGRPGDDARICDIAVACALGYLDFRFAAEPWRPGRPRLSAFFDAFTLRPAWAQSDPARAR